MKKKETVRTFNFSDAVLITKGKEKIAFMKTMLPPEIVAKNLINLR